LKLFQYLKCRGVISEKAEYDKGNFINAYVYNGVYINIEEPSNMIVRIKQTSSVNQ